MSLVQVSALDPLTEHVRDAAGTAFGCRSVLASTACCNTSHQNGVATIDWTRHRPAGRLRRLSRPGTVVALLVRSGIGYRNSLVRSSFGFRDVSRAAEHRVATLTPETRLSKPHNPCLRNGGTATLTSTGMDYEKAPMWLNPVITRAMKEDGQSTPLTHLPPTRTGATFARGGSQ